MQCNELFDAQLRLLCSSPFRVLIRLCSVDARVKEGGLGEMFVLELLVRGSLSCSLRPARRKVAQENVLLGLELPLVVLEERQPLLCIGPDDELTSAVSSISFIPTRSC